MRAPACGTHDDWFPDPLPLLRRVAKSLSVSGRYVTFVHRTLTPGASI